MINSLLFLLVAWKLCTLLVYPTDEDSGILISSVCIALLVLAGRGGKGGMRWDWGGILKWGS
jgi:hypothetical protein